MTDRAKLHPDHVEGAGPEGFDREVNLRAVVWAGVGLIAATAVAALLMYGMVIGFGRFDARREPAPPPLPEARRQAPPPAPRLQNAPERDLGTMRALEARRLREAAWVDRARGTVRIPIEVAMDAVVAGVRPVGGAAAGQGGGPPAGVAVPPVAAGTIGGRVAPQPMADAESRRPRPQTEEAPPPR